MRWLRILGSLLAMAVLFAVGWSFYMHLHREQERSVQSAPLPDDRIRPANRISP